MINTLVNFESDGRIYEWVVISEGEWDRDMFLNNKPYYVTKSYVKFSPYNSEKLNFQLCFIFDRFYSRDVDYEANFLDDIYGEINKKVFITKQAMELILMNIKNNIFKYMD
jgi:hypothetical protein